MRWKQRAAIGRCGRLRSLVVEDGPSGSLGFRRVVFLSCRAMVQKEDESCVAKTMNLDRYVRIARYAGLGEPELLREELARTSDEPDAIANMLGRHHLLSLVCAVAGERAGETPPADIVARLAARQPPRKVSVDELMRAFVEIRAALDERAVPALLLKGFYFADRLYGSLERRPQYDIDLLVRRAHFDAALQAFGALGFARKSTDFHSQTLARGVVHIDLHHSPRRSPAYSFDEAAVWSRAREARAADLEFRTLADEDYVTMLGTSLFEDVGFGKVYLKQMLDLYLLLRDNDAEIDWPAYLNGVPAGVARITANVLSLVAGVFDADGELGHLNAALARHRDLIEPLDREQALHLVFAPHGEVENMLWFARIYPGSMLYYRARFWMRTFPANLRNFDANWLRRNARLVVRTWTSPRRRPS